MSACFGCFYLSTCYSVSFRTGSIFFLVKIIELVILLSLDFICYQIDIEFWMLLMFVVAI